MEQIILKDIRKSTIVELPSYPKSEIILWDDLLFGEIDKINKIKDDTEKGYAVLVDLIKDWNLYDEEKKKLVPSKEVFMKLPVKDLTFLMQKVGKILNPEKEEIKKNSKS